MEYTVYSNEFERIDDAPVGTKKEVSTWMRKHFPGLKKKSSPEENEASIFFFDGDVVAYDTANDGEVYLVELEEDKDAYKIPSKKEKKRLKKLEKERIKTNESRAKVGMPPDEDKVNMEASIEYIKDGNYYLIKYERGSIRAWGAIKSCNGNACQNSLPNLRD